MAKIFKYRLQLVLILLYAGFFAPAQGQTNYTKLSPDSLHNIAYNYLDRAPDSSILFCDIGLKKVGNKPGKQWARLMTIKSFAYERLGFYRKALNQLILVKKYFAKTNDKKSYANTVNSIGVMYDYMGNLDSAGLYYEEGYAIRKKIKDTDGLSSSAGNLGLLYLNKGLFKKALDYLFQSKKNAEKSNDQSSLSSIYTNIGLAYDRQGNLLKALEYYRRSAKIDSLLDDHINLALSFNNIGAVYFAKNDFKKALYYHSKSLHLKEKAGNRAGLGITYHNLGLVYAALDSNQQALRYFDLSIKANTEIGDDAGLFESYIDFGNYYNKLKQYSKAIVILKKAIKLHEQKHLYGNIDKAYRYLSKAYAEIGKYKEAHEYFMMSAIIHDSLNSFENSKKLTEHELNSAYEHQKEVDSLKRRSELRDRRAELRERKAKEKHDFIIRVAMVCGMIALLIIIVIVLRGYRNKQIANKNLLERNNVITAQHAEIELQKQEIEAKNKDITDSIHYALRLQNTMLPPDTFLKSHLDEYFILFKPKDIVSGDFYWSHDCGHNKFLFAVIDCTGHGVPGSMVSIIANNALNRAVSEFKLIQPAHILNKIAELVEEYFNKNSADEIRDGMDISLCLYDKNTKEMEFAGAYNSLWIVRKNEISGNFELMEIKADKQPIGRYEYRSPYTNHVVQLQSGDWIYLHTDGYGDQFGGPDVERGGKKFKSSRLKQMLVQAGYNPAAIKKSELENTLSEWAKGYEQNDDICIMGVKIK